MSAFNNQTINSPATQLQSELTKIGSFRLHYYGIVFLVLCFVSSVTGRISRRMDSESLALQMTPDETVQCVYELNEVVGYLPH